MIFQKSFFPDIFEDLNQSFDVEDVYIEILRIYILIKGVKINARFEFAAIFAVVGNPEKRIVWEFR